MTAAASVATGARRALAAPRALDRRLVAPGPSGLLVLVHRLLAAAIAFRLVERPWWRMADRPPALFEPVWAVSWLSSPPDRVTVAVIQLVGVAAGIAAVTRRAPRASFAVAWACLVFVAACWGSSGKVMHNEVLLVTVAFPLLFSAMPRRGDAPSWSTAWGWAPRAAATALGAVYFATGFQKLRHSGLDWVFSDNMAWVVRQGTSPFGKDLNVALARHGWLMVALAGGALAFELGAPLLLWCRRTRIVVPVVSLVMHASIWALLGLNYSPWVFTCAAVTVPLSMRWPGPDGEATAGPWWRRIVWPSAPAAR